MFLLIKTAESSYQHDQEATLHGDYFAQPLYTQLQIPRKLGLGNWCLGVRKVAQQ